MEIESRIKEVMAKTFNLTGDQITTESSIDSIADWDSLNHSNLVIALEQEFGVTFDAMEIIDLLNYQIILLTLREKISS